MLFRFHNAFLIGDKKMGEISFHKPVRKAGACVPFCRFPFLSLMGAQHGRNGKSFRFAVSRSYGD